MSSTNDTMNFGVDLLPITTESYDIGSDQKVWRNIYGTLTGDVTGNASTATTLKTGRTLRVSLGSTSASTAFDGSANISDIGVDGTLAETNGGTGQNTYTKGQILYASAANTLSKLNIGTAGYFLKATANGPTWANTTDITALGTITTGTWNATTIGAGYGGTGQSTYTVGDILYCGTANTLSKLGGNTTTTRKFLRSVATTSGTAVAPAWDTVTKTDVGLGNVTNDAQVKASLGTAKGDMLYWSASATPARLAIGTAGYFLKATADGPAWANTTDITALGTIGTGTWQGTTIATGYGGTGVTSHTANRLVWSISASAIQAADNHYVSSTQMSINFTSAPHSGYTLLVGGHSEINGALSLQQPNSSTQSLYFKNHTSTVLGVGARIYYWNGSASGITHSQLNFQEYSYSTTASATPSSYYEQYSLPDCNAGLGANAAYNILTDKAVTPFPIVGRGLPSNATFDTLTTPGVYAINNNLASSATFPSSQTHAKYGALLHVAGLTAGTGAYNNAIQLWLSGITNSSNYRLFIRGNYYNSTGWQGWAQIPLNIPNPPTTAGTYKLKVTVTNSVASYSWVSG